MAREPKVYKWLANFALNLTLPKINPCEQKGMRGARWFSSNGKFPLWQKPISLQLPSGSWSEIRFSSKGKFPLWQKPISLQLPVEVGGDKILFKEKVSRGTKTRVCFVHWTVLLSTLPPPPLLPHFQERDSVSFAREASPCPKKWISLQIV